MTQHRAALSALLRPEFKAGGGFNRPGFTERYDTLLDAAGVPRDVATIGDNGGPPMVDVVVPPAIGMISASLLRVGCPERSLVELEPWVQPIRASCLRFEINTIRRVAAFVAQMAHESGMQPRSENLNYSVDALLEKFGRHRISAVDARRYGRREGHPANQQAIANCIYGGDWGEKNLGNTEPTDGWDLRGAGPLQGTGRGNWMRFAAAMGMTLADALAYGRTLEGGIMFAAWFWEANDINRLADTPGVADESRAINGGSNGLADRERRFDALVAAMLKLEKAA